MSVQIEHDSSFSRSRGWSAEAGAAVGAALLPLRSSKAGAFDGWAISRSKAVISCSLVSRWMCNVEEKDTPIICYWRRRRSWSLFYNQVVVAFAIASSFRSR